MSHSQCKPVQLNYFQNLPKNLLNRKYLTKYTVQCTFWYKY
jgi:hypothetical protein